MVILMILAKYVGKKYCISCSSGTDALLIPLMAKKFGPGDAILTTPFTYIATAEVIAILGATPVFVDVYKETYNINPDGIEEAIMFAKRKNLKPTGFMVGQNKLYLSNSDGNLIVVDVNSGKLSEIKKVSRNLISKPYFDNGDLFVVKNGSVIQYD